LAQSNSYLNDRRHHSMQRCILIISIYCLTACGLTQQPEPVIEVLMYALPKASEASEGTFTPRYYDITVNTITLFLADNAEGIVIDVTEDEKFRIIAREQIVLSSSIADYEDAQLVGVGIELEPEFTAAGKYRSNHILTFQESNIRHTQDVLIEKNRSLKLDIQLNWLNTVTLDEEIKDESLISPDINISLKSTRM
jgi:hypothetical protein